MELTVSRDTLLVGLRRVQGIVERRAAMALLSNVLIESVASDRVHITGTNLELFLQGEYDMDVTSPGRVCANARHLFEIVQNLEPSARGELEITDVNNAYIERGEMEYELVDGWWLDAGENHESLLRASITIARQEGVDI